LGVIQVELLRSNELGRKEKSVRRLRTTLAHTTKGKENNREREREREKERKRKRKRTWTTHVESSQKSKQ
jgi:hypothetical protein